MPALAGCSDPESPVHIADVENASSLRGMQVARLEIEPGLEVVRVELFLDGPGVADDDFAPLELARGARNFDDGVD